LEIIDEKVGFVFPELPKGDYTLSLTHEIMGTASMEDGDVVFSTPLSFDSVVPNQGSLGGNVLTISGNGFQS